MPTRGRVNEGTDEEASSLFMKKAKPAASIPSLLIELEGIGTREEEARTIRDALRALREQRLVQDEVFPGTLLALAIELQVQALKARGLNSKQAAKVTIRFHERVAMIAAAYGTLTKESIEQEIVSVITAGETPLEQMVLNLRVTRALNAREIADQLVAPGRIHVLTSRVQRRHPESRALVRMVERILNKYRAVLEEFGSGPDND